MASRPRGVKLFAVETKFKANMRQAMDEFGKKLEKQVLRPAAYAGASVIYDGMRMKVPVASGTLRDSIYHWHDDKRSRDDRQIYMIGPNKGKAPHWYNVEFGHWLYNNRTPDGRWLRSKSQPNARGPEAHDLPGARKERKWVMPQPYIRPTWDTYGNVAITAMIVRMNVLFGLMK